jgi:hypothetical protein
MARREQEVTKGSKPREFKFASNMGKLEVPEGKVGRWCDSRQDNVLKKLEEGWEPVNKTNCPSARRLEELGLGPQVNEGTEKAGPVRYRDMIGMMLDKDLKVDRDRQIEEKTLSMTKAKIFMKEDKAALGEHANILKPTLSID